MKLSVPVAMRCACLAAILVAPALADAQPHDRKLGTISFPNSGNAASQAPFMRGVLLYHSFEYADAATSFREAQKADPTFALAYWGEALTYTHQVWNQQDLGKAREALNRLAPAPGARRALAKTDRERMYMDLAEALYGDGGKARRDTLFNAAAERLAATFPSDDEAAVLHALGLLGLSQGERDVASYMKAGAIAEAVLRRNPDHPGAAHFVIHAFDDPTHAPVGLWAARLYSQIAPAAPHALHMTSHIFLAVGQWDDVVDVNRRAVASQMAARMSAGAAQPAGCGHYNEWLHYGLLQAGRVREAREVLDGCASRQSPDAAVDNVEGYAGFRAAQIIDAGTEGAIRPADSAPRGTAGAKAYMAFGSGYAAWLAANAAGVTAARAAAESAAREQAAKPDPYVAILILGLRALERSAANDLPGAIALVRDAARADDALPVPFGPPQTVKPPHELLGELLLKAGKARDAQAEFQRALAATPGRSRTLLGVARAAVASGDAAVARSAIAHLRANWHAADQDLPELAELSRLSASLKE